MKIGLVIDSMDGNRAGIGRYCFNLVKNIKKLDKENDYVLIHREKSDDEIYKGNGELSISYPNIPLKKTVGNYFQLPLKLRDYPLDVVHDLTQVSPFTLYSQSKKILTIHDLSPILFPENYGIIHGFLQKHILPRTLKNVDTIITVSYNTKVDVLKYLKFRGDKIREIPLGVDEKFKPQKNTIDFMEKYNINSPFILYVGTLEPRKNIPTLIKAFYKLKRKDIEHKLIISGGKGWKYKEIYETIEKLNLQKEVIFTGYVPEEDLPRLYNSADLFVYPSLYEGFGLPPLEAMACGCPVVASKTSSLPEVVGNAGILVNPHDVDDISNKMYETLTNEGLREELSRMGSERAKLFSWEKVAKETLKVYEEVGMG